MTIKNILEKIKYLVEKTKDTGWQTATLTSDFKAYKDDNTYLPQFKKQGNIVSINGIVSPTSIIKGSSDSVTIFTLPEEYRPTQIVYMVCQGTSINKWLLTISTNGTVSFSRYGNSQTIDASDTTWLPFSATFSI